MPVMTLTEVLVSLAMPPARNSSASRTAAESAILSREGRKELIQTDGLHDHIARIIRPEWMAMSASQRRKLL